MKYILYSETSDKTVQARLGAPEYSYYFVRETFRTLLEKHHDVAVVTNPEREVDPLYDLHRANGDDCLFLSFAPPHRTCLSLRCPTVPVFAWEFDTIPTDVWDDDLRNDWRTVLWRLGRAITHSQYSVQAIKAALGENFPVMSLPAPVWDTWYSRMTEMEVRNPEEIEVRAGVLDSSRLPHGARPGFGTGGNKSRWLRRRARWRKSFAKRARRVAPFVAHWFRENATPTTRPPVLLPLSGIIYTSVFSPYDGRKNWEDMLTAFCVALSDCEDATLILKLVHHDNTLANEMIANLLTKLPPHRCRVIVIDGFLSESEYGALMAATTFVVNTSHGEGQCLPLMEFMSAGKPAVTPQHTGMADYIDEEVAFIVRSSQELCCWPHDPRWMLRAHRHRIDWQSLVEAYRASYSVAKQQPETYERMSRGATARQREHCSEAAVYAKLKELVEQATSTYTPQIASVGAGAFLPLPKPA